MKLADELNYRKIEAGGPGSGPRPGSARVHDFAEGQKVKFYHPDHVGPLTGHVTNADGPTLAIAYNYGGKPRTADIHHTKVFKPPASGESAIPKSFYDKGN